MTAAESARRQLAARLAEVVTPADAAEIASLTARLCDVIDPASPAVTQGVEFRFGPHVVVPVPHLRSVWGTGQAPVARSLNATAAVLRAAHPTTLVRCYPAVAARLVDPDPSPSPGAGAGPGAGLGLPDAEGWLVAVRLGEAVRILLEDAALADDPGTVRSVLPLVRRARFLLLSAPAVLPAGQWAVRRAFGSERALASRAEQARLAWALDLVNHDEHTALRQRPDAALDNDLRRLAVPALDAVTGSAGPPGPSGAAASDAERAQFRTWLAQEAFLPRFMLRSTWSAIRPPVVAWSVLVLLAVVAASPLLGLRWAAEHPEAVLRATAAVAGAAYLLIGLLAIYRSGTANLWCLRLPAGAAIGMVALVSVDDDWATSHGLAWLWASVVLAVASVGYLVTEAIGHGVPRGGPLVGRVAAVTLLGYAHAAGVAAITLTAVVPAVKPGLAETIAGTGGGAAAGTEPLAVGPMTVLAASVGLAAGVLLQVLWDDRPVTYPLTHLPWRGRVR